MKIETATALVTGANRGLGRAIAAELLARGATVYAAARRPETVDLPGARPVALDITDPASVAAAAQAAPDVNLLVNNAGLSTGSNLLTGDLDRIRLEMDTHYFGTLAVTRALVPALTANAANGAAVLNILSVLSWLTLPATGAYAAAKSAEWSLTNALRLQLAPQGVRVAGLHVGFIDTDMAARVTAPKLAPEAVARAAIDGLEADLHEILVDDLRRATRANLAGGVPALYPALA